MGPLAVLCTLQAPFSLRHFALAIPLPGIPFPACQWGSLPAHMFPIHMANTAPFPAFISLLHFPSQCLSTTRHCYCVYWCPGFLPSSCLSHPFLPSQHFFLFTLPSIVLGEQADLDLELVSVTSFLTMSKSLSSFSVLICNMGLNTCLSI